MASDKRKELKNAGLITSGFINYPARLMVNCPGEFDASGKKKYKLHSDFSKIDVSK